MGWIGIGRECTVSEVPVEAQIHSAAQVDHRDLVGGHLQDHVVCLTGSREHDGCIDPDLAAKLRTAGGVGDGQTGIVQAGSRVGMLRESRRGSSAVTEIPEIVRRRGCSSRQVDEVSIQAQGA